MESLLQLIAVTSGILALAKGVLDVLKEYSSNRDTLSNLWRSRRFKLGASLGLVGLAVLASTVWWLSSQVPFRLTVQMWEVDNDQKSRVTASKEFVGNARTTLPNETISEVANWIKEELSVKYGSPTAPLDVHVEVPSDLLHSAITIQSTVPLERHFWLIEGSSKVRVRLDDAALATLARDFILEIGRPGYEARMLAIKWGQPYEERITLRPRAIIVGVEEFAGDPHSTGRRVSGLLAQDAGLSIIDPARLKDLRDEIAKREEQIAANPMIQVGLRRSLGVDFIVTGHFEEP